MPLPYEDHAEVTLTYQNGNSDRMPVNVFTVQNLGNMSPELIASNVATDWTESLAAITCDFVSLASVRVVNWVGEFHEELVSIDGTLVDAVASPQVAYLVKKTTPLIGRGNQGRMYLPGVPQDEITGEGLLEDVFYAAADAVPGVFFGKLAADGLDMAIAHADGSEPTPVAGLELDQRVATQRRRLR